MFEILPGYLFTAAFIWLLTATVWRLATWALTPSPLPIPLAPTPRTRVGVAGRLMLECFGFRSLARADKVTWLASLAFHYGLLLVLMVHLRFVLPQLPIWLIPFIRISSWATVGLMLGLAVLLLRRIIVDRIRYGYVVDFILWHPGFDWPTFNIADMLIVIGVSMMFIEIIRDAIRQKKEQKAEA